MIVVDTNLIAYLWLPGEHTKLAEEVLRKDPQWAAPSLWRSEFRSVLAGYIRLKKMPLDTAIHIMDEAETLFQGREYFVPSLKILELIPHTPCSAYDLEFIALAKDLGGVLVTTDKQVIKAFPALAVSALSFLSKH